MASQSTDCEGFFQCSRSNRKNSLLSEVEFGAEVNVALNFCDAHEMNEKAEIPSSKLNPKTKWVVLINSTYSNIFAVNQIKFYAFCPDDRPYLFPAGFHFSIGELVTVTKCFRLEFVDGIL